MAAMMFVAAGPPAPVPAPTSTSTSASASARAFRVCADPNDLPYSDTAHQGYENRIAALLARDLEVPLEFVWFPQVTGFARKTVNAGACDVIMGVPAHYDPVLTTAPYLRSTYALVYRADRGYHLRSLDDPALASLRIGVHLNTPPAVALGDRAVGFPIIGDYGQPSPAARLIDAVAHDSIDVAIAWGPLAGYFATREAVPLVVVPLTDPRFAFDIALGVRHADTAFAALLDTLLVRERPAIQRILHDYGVPVLAGADQEKQ